MFEAGKGRKRENEMNSSLSTRGTVLLPTTHLHGNDEERNDYFVLSVFTVVTNTPKKSFDIDLVITPGILSTKCTKNKYCVTDIRYALF